MKDFIIKRKKLVITILILFITSLLSLPLIYYKKIQDTTPFDIVVANVTTSSAEIYWKSKDSNIQSLSYKEKNSTTPYKEVHNPIQRNDLSTHSNLYIQKIEDLLPEKTYIFRIRYNGNKTDKKITFKTTKVDSTLTFPTIEAGEGPKETFVLISMDGENIIVDTQDHGTWAFDSKGKEYSTSNYATYTTEKSLGEKLKDLLRVKNIYFFTAYAEDGGNWWEEAPNCDTYDPKDVPVKDLGFSKDDVRRLMNRARYSSCGQSHYGEICYSDVICHSVNQGINPGIVFAIWYQETQGSNFQGYHARNPNSEMPWHFGINMSGKESFRDQLDQLLTNLKDKQNSYAGAKTMVDFALISSDVGINDKVKVFISQIEYLAGTAPDGGARQTGFDDPFLNAFTSYTSDVKTKLGEAKDTIEGIRDDENCKKYLENLLDDKDDNTIQCDSKDDIKQAVNEYKKATKYLQYLRLQYGEENQSITSYSDFGKNGNYDTGFDKCTKLIGVTNKGKFSVLSQEKTAKECMQNLACALKIYGGNSSSEETDEETEKKIKISPYGYNTYAYNIALNYCQLTGKNLFQLKYPPTITRPQDPKCKNPTVNTTVVDCIGGDTSSSGSTSGGSSGSSGGNKVVGNPGSRPPTAPVKPPYNNPNDPNNNPDRDEMLVDNETKYCTNKNGCICIYNYQKPNERRIEIKNGQKCTPNQEVQETKKVCCQFPNKGLYTVDEYNCTEENTVRNDRSGSTCDSKAISYNFRPGYNIIQMQEIHNKTDVPLTTAKKFIDISEKSVITVSKFTNNKWGETVILKDGNVHGADFDIKQGEVYLVTSKDNLRLDTLGIKVIPSSNIPTAQGWSLIPTNDLQAGLTTHQIYSIDRYKNIEQVALLDNIKNSFIYTIKDEKGELIGEDISLSNYDAIFLKLKADNP